MERDRSYRSTMSLTSRFERCKTPSGSVPISVIMGFEYPLADQYSGRGESSSYSNGTDNYSYSNYSNLNSTEFDRKNRYTNMKFLNTTLSNTRQMLDSLDSRLDYGSGYSTSGPSSREQRENLSRSRYVRAQTEARDLLRSSRERYVLCSDPSEHPKQQACRYPTALSEYTSTNSNHRNVRAKTVAPMVVSPARHHSSFMSNNRFGWSSSASRNYFSSVRSRFL